MKIKEITYGLARFFPAFMLMMYGVSKILGTQFGVSEWIADLPMSQQTGFHLTWYYFNYSMFYGYVLASVQIGGAILLLFRRTALLGTVMLLPVMTNIVLMNVVYGITDGALLMSILIFISLFVILLFHFNELVNFFWRDRKTADESEVQPGKGRFLSFIGKSAIIAVPVLILIFSKMNETPTSPFEGVWDVAEWHSDSEHDEVPNRIYFETIATHSAMFRFPEFRRQYGFDFDIDSKEISIFLRRTDGPENFFDGTYKLTDDTLYLEGSLLQSDKTASIILSRVR